MKRKPSEAMRESYDFSAGVRGKYARRFAAGTNIVALAPDVAQLFRDSSSVNDTLRPLARIAARQKKAAAR